MLVVISPAKKLDENCDKNIVFILKMIIKVKNTKNKKTTLFKEIFIFFIFWFEISDTV